MLVASLPHIPRSFEVEQVPISRIRLQQRLSILSDNDRQVVEQMQSFLLWDRQHPERTNEEVRLEYDRLMTTITNELLRDMIAHRMDVRTITSAFRRRRLDLPPPNEVGQFVSHIAQHWTHPDFALARRHPWIPEFREHFEAGEPRQAERQLLLSNWKRWSRLADQYHFSFEAILLYLARWEIVDCWTRLDEVTGRQRFEVLLMETLADHVHTSQ